MNTFDASNNQVDLFSGVNFTANPGDFVAFALDASDIEEVELFQGEPMTIDDFAYGRDDKLALGAAVSSVPEPVSLLFLLLGAALLAPTVIRRRA